MAGFDPFGSTTFDFANTRYAGAVVKVRTDHTVEETVDLYSKLTGERDLRKQVEIFAPLLESWNLTAGKPAKDIPPTLDGLKKAPGPFVRHLISLWLENVWEVKSPLDGSEK